MLKEFDEAPTGLGRKGDKHRIRTQTVKVERGRGDVRDFLQESLHTGTTGRLVGNSAGCLSKLRLVVHRLQGVRVLERRGLCAPQQGNRSW